MAVIQTAMIIPYEEILESLQRIEKRLDSITKQPAAVTLPDRINKDEARELLGGISNSKLYKLTSSGSIPHSVFGGRLIFSRRDLDQWIQENTQRVNPAKDASEILAKAARKKVRP